MLLSHHKSAGQNPDMKIGNRFFENVDLFRYWGTTITNQNQIQDEIKRRLLSGNACYRSVQNLLSSHLLPKNIKIRIYQTIILRVVVYGCEIWSLTLRKGHRLRVLRRIFIPKNLREMGWIGLIWLTRALVNAVMNLRVP
jgi:hypothetical protein